MGVGESRRHVARDPERILDGQLTLPREPAPRRFTFDNGHRVIEAGATIGCGPGSRVVQREDVRVAETRRDLDLAQEPVGSHRVGELRMQDL
jgi:hypothetical protein